jgi:pantothenate kinase
VQDITTQVTTLAERVHALRSDHPRLLLAITGAPGSGKSTLAAELSRRLRVQKCPNSVVPMDGFHLDNQVLEDRSLSQRKGAPETFDAAGLIRLVQALRAREDVVAPRFDRTRDIAIAGAIPVAPNCPVVIVEGNYLMFDEDPWRALAPLWDLTARISTPMPELRARLIQRWLSMNLSRAAATRRAESNDIPNAQRVIDKMIPCDFTFGADAG